MLTRLAPAKINLYLHVAAADASGYHPLQSLVVFADIGDAVTLRDEPGLAITGPFAEGLGTGEDNLITKAARLFEGSTGIAVSHGFHLDKQLPLASGIGGGTADAGACLHLLRAAYAPRLSDNALTAIAAGLGADGPMCLWSRAAVAEHYGETLTSVRAPSLPAVLVNPLVECSTREVYHLFDRCKPVEIDDVQPTFLRESNAGKWLDGLRQTRNDLERAAIGLQPVIADVLSTLEAQPQTRLVRMSGSGATCFALCDTLEDANALSVRMQALWPSAWVRACRLG